MGTLVATVLALVLSSSAASPARDSGLRGKVLVVPGYPTCPQEAPCTRPARQVELVFRWGGRVVARTHTNVQGKYRITLAPRTYRVTFSPGRFGKKLTERVTVRSGRYRRVVFKVDIGVRQAGPPPAQR